MGVDDPVVQSPAEAPAGVRRLLVAAQVQSLVRRRDQGRLTV